MARKIELASLFLTKMSTNYSLYAIPVGWAFAIIPHFYAVSLTSNRAFPSEFNNVSPRDYLQLIRSQEKQSPVRHTASLCYRETDPVRRSFKSTCEPNPPTLMVSRTSATVSPPPSYRVACTDAS